MRRTYCLLFILILPIFFLTACSPQVIDHSEEVFGSFSAPPQRIVLLPLDSRPACTSMVARLARIGNVDLILPPQEMLDHYHTPADCTSLRTWLQEECHYTDTLIVSADMLLHGSLLHSRENELTDEDIASTIQFFRTLRRDNPNLKFYVFSTIPRLLIADDSDTAQYQKDMLTYSTLQEEVLLFGQTSLLDDLRELEDEIPPDILERYHRLYERNRLANEVLIALVKDHTIDHLVIGQDDGHVFGLPNIVKDHLDRYIHHDPDLSAHIQIVRGADELAMLLVSRIHADARAPLAVYVAYNDDTTGGTIMPFMSQSVNTTVNEKIASINACRTAQLEDADFILYVYIGNDANNIMLAQNSLAAIRRFDTLDKPIALVDLSEHFRASETLFPVLLADGFPLHRLIAYAGWNTASNAIGTAIAQAGIYANAMRSSTHKQEKLAISHANLTFLNDRFLDDYYYMKLIQPYLKLRLSALTNDPYQLSEQTYYEANDWLTNAMQNQAALLFATDAYQCPFRIAMSNLDETFVITELTVETSLPWERIFEANVFSKIIIKNLQKSVDTSP